jgi:anti-anti-sigma regulatory factor
MPLALEPSSKGMLLRLPESATVNCVAELHQLFLDASRASQNIEIDFARTAELDASVLQLLYRACQTAGRAGLTIEVAGALPELVEKTFREAGLDPFRRALQSLGK